MQECRKAGRVVGRHASRQARKQAGRRASRQAGKKNACSKGPAFFKRRNGTLETQAHSVPYAVTVETKLRESRAAGRPGGPTFAEHLKNRNKKRRNKYTQNSTHEYATPMPAWRSFVVTFAEHLKDRNKTKTQDQVHTKQYTPVRNQHPCSRRARLSLPFCLPEVVNHHQKHPHPNTNPHTGPYSTAVHQDTTCAGPIFKRLKYAHSRKSLGP